MNNITNKYRIINIPKRFRIGSYLIRETLNQENEHLKLVNQIYGVK